jgi:hypothetical protein
MILAGPTVQTGSSEKSNLKFEAVNGRHTLIQVWSDVEASGNDFPNGGASAERDKRNADVTITSGR